MLCVPVVGKKPLLKDWPNAASADRAQWRQWLQQYPRAGLAAITGRAGGIIVIDVDARGEEHDADGIAALEGLKSRLGALPKTVESRTPSGGSHYFFRWPAGLVARIPSRPLRPGVDIRADGAMVAIPTGKRTPGRTWVLDPREQAIAALPARWLGAVLPSTPARPAPAPRWSNGGAHCAARAARIIERAAERVAAAAPGTRHAALVAAARLAGGVIAGMGADHHDAAALLTSAATAAGLPADEAHAAIQWGIETGSADPVM